MIKIDFNNINDEIVYNAFQGVTVDILKGEFSQEVWRASIERFIFGHVHMWFLQMLCGFYILIPIARQICAKKEAIRYYVLLWILFRYLIPCLTSIFHLEIVQARFDSLGLDILAGNFGYFLLGYYLNTVDIKKQKRWLIYISGIVSVFMTAILTIWNCRKTGTYVETWFSPASINVLIMSIAIFTGFKYSSVFEKVRNPNMWKKVADYTFFVYMFHMFIIEKLNLIGITTVSYPAIISIPVLTIFTFLLSLLGAFIVDHVKVLRKLWMLH